MEMTIDGVAEQVALAQTNYTGLAAIPFATTTEPANLYLATPDRYAYALGWIVANQIVQARYSTAGIDVLPIFHPENGWDRMVITRRVTSHIYGTLPADELGRIMLSGDDAPRFVQPAARIRMGLRELLELDADAAVTEVLARVPAQPGGVGDLKRMRPSERAPLYPALYAAITQLVVEYPGIVPSREIFIDDEPIDGQYHPLHLHGAELSSHGSTDRHGAILPVTTYNWFQLQYGETFAFVDKRGTRAVYRTDRHTWARPKVQISEGPSEQIGARIAGWLRLDGATPQEGVD